MTTKITPTAGRVYSLRTVLLALDLDDTPHLTFDHFGSRCVVQNSHLSSADLLSIPGFATTHWRYLHTTREWIPVFAYADVLPISRFVDIVPQPHNSTDYWVMPKGFHRELEPEC